MRLLIAAVGKLKHGPERELFAHYLDRAHSIGRKIGLAPLSVIEVAEAKGATAQVRVETEAKSLLAKLPSSHKLISLDRGGDQLGSEDFAQVLAKFRDGGIPGLAFFVGGADGLGLAAQFKADRVLSLGPMTLPHGLARIVLAEQIYRAGTFLAGHPYHRGRTPPG
jgi:23S rRNA (pseudouridine1915-N3)-methyltransferase